jgi:hypothetical protein
LCSACELQKPSYPVDACSCSEIDQANTYDVHLAKKGEKGSFTAVLLSPAVSLERTIDDKNIVVSNFRSAALLGDPKHPGNRFWRSASASPGEGYFLHQCEAERPLVPLGTDREKALAEALRIVEAKKGDQETTKDGN